MAAILTISKYFIQIHFDISRYGKMIRNFARKSNFDVVDVTDDVRTAWRQIGFLYSCLNEIVTFSVIHVASCNRSSLNLVHICSRIRHIGLQMLSVKGQMTTSRNKKSRSNFEIVITLSIFELERRTKSENVGDSMAYIGIILNFQYMFRFKRSPEPQNAI